ncbi:MAG TPA: glycosyltransferase [Acidimicrobiales bacterium]|nr:glycosyltransferase [Acidimicrobiales bacterium]
MGPARRILVLAFDPLTEAMAGPAIRAWQLALALAGAGHAVTLAGTAGATRAHPALRVCPVGDEGERLDRLVAGADMVFAPTSVVRRHPEVRGAAVPLAVDLSIPTHLENLERGGRSTEEWEAGVAHQVAVVNEDLARGDFFVCASERQRDFWLGSLSQAGRVNPATFEDDPALRRLVDVVPFGIPAAPPVPAPGTLRAAFGAIGPDDPVLVWGGGVYDWFDPVTVVRAVDRLRGSVPALRLVFLGMTHPNPGIPEMARARQLRAVVAELGLEGSHVFFNESWVPYDAWGATLLDADVAVSTHFDALETRFSFRTRVLDYLWARRPMVLTGGDALSDLVTAHGVGIAVGPGDVAGVADAVARLLADPPAPERFDAPVAALQWPVAAGPLVAWAAAGRGAPDRAGVSGPG